jgi:hypothetical protein
MSSKVFIIALAVWSINAFADEVGSMLPDVVRSHQQCALRQFFELVKTTDHFDPNLKGKAVEQCESVLEPLKSAIINKTGNAALAETTAEKIRKSSERGITIAAKAYIEKRDPAEVRDEVLRTTSTKPKSTTQKCQNEFWLKIAKDLLEKPAKPGQPTTVDQAQRMQPFNISAQYMEDMFVKTCELKEVSSQLQGPQFQALCPHSKSTYRVQCYKEWLSSQDVSYASLVSLLDTVATGVAIMDKNAGADKNVAILMMIDANLIPLERLSTAKNVAFTPVIMTPSMRQAALDLHLSANPQAMMTTEKNGLKQVERQTFSETKQRLISVLEAKLSEVRQAWAREPASASTKSWIESSIKSLSDRIKRAKSRQI